MNTNRLAVVVAICAVIMMALSGCAMDMNQVDREIGSGRPDGYRYGYADGCNSGNVAAGHPYYRFSKDIQSYSSDDLYRQGWNDGFSTCKGKYEAIGRALSHK